MIGLTDPQIKAFKRDGFIFPLKAMEADEARWLRKRLEAIETERGSLTGKFRSPKNHLLMTWFDRLIRHSKILDPIEQLLGPNPGRRDIRMACPNASHRTFRLHAHDRRVAQMG